MTEFTMPRVFIAGPFRADTPYDVELNIRKAEDLGIRVAKLGAVPVIFHTMYRHLQGALPGKFIDEASLQLVSSCHAMAVTVGQGSAAHSTGTLGDMAFAKSMHMPIFFASSPCSTDDIPALAQWIEKWKFLRAKVNHSGLYGRTATP